MPRFGFQRDWRYASAKQDDETFGAARGQFNTYDGSEYLEAAHCLKPAPYLVAGDMTGKWNVLAGSWRVTSPSVTSPRSVWGDYYLSGPQEYGQIESYADFTSNNVVLGIIREALPEDTEDYPRYVSIRFNGSTAQPSFRKVAFVFPYGMKSRRHPYVLDALTSEAPGGLTDANMTALWDGGGGSGAKLDDDRKVEFLFFELIDGAMVVRHSDKDKAFVYRPYERNDPQFKVGAWAPGTISITVYGHAAMVYCSNLTYPKTSSALAQPYQYISDIYSDMTDEALTKWHCHFWRPDDKWAVVATKQQHQTMPGLSYAPQTAFAWAGVGLPQNCPVSYVTTLDIQSTHAAGVSAPDALEGQGVVLAVDYTLKLAGRGQTCSVIVDDPTGAKAAAWKGQNLVAVACGYDDLTPTQKFLGYLGEQPEITREGGETVGRPQYKLDLQDPVDARLSCKFMQDKSAAGYEKLAVWVYRLLYDAGEPAAYLTDILALTTGSMVDIIIPGSYGAKDLAHDFEATVAVPDALDKVTGALGYSWGWNCETGQWFLRPAKLLYSGTPDWTLNIAAAAAGGAYALNLKHIKSKHEFRNYMMMIAQTTGGAESVNLWADRNSHLLSTASNFIGTDLWEIVRESDLWSGLAKGQARWAELQGLPSVISWDMAQALPGTLGPGKYVKAQVTLMGASTDAIYRIVEERGELPFNSLEYRQSLTAEWVQNA